MDESEVQSLLTAQEARLSETIAQLKDSLTGLIHSSNQGVAANLQRSIAEIKERKGSAKPATEGDKSPAVEALTTELEQLKQSLASQQAAAEAAEKSAAISAVVASSNVVSPSIFKTFVSAQYGNTMVRDDATGKWYIGDGSSTSELSTAVADFLATPEAAIFLPAAPINGSGSRESRAVPSNDNVPSAANALNAAFSQI